MGSTRVEREYMRAKSAYSGAAHQLVLAMAEWEAARVPLLPGPGGDLELWTAHQIRVTVAAAQAWQQLITHRRTYDALAREVTGQGGVMPGARATRPVGPRGGQSARAAG